jgi:hypothetical protein
VEKIIKEKANTLLAHGKTRERLKEAQTNQSQLG